MTTHDAGPWRLQHFNEDPGFRIRAVVDSKGATICTFVRDSGHQSAVRNGAVLAAAPDLLTGHQRNERVLTEALAALADVRHWGEEPGDARENLRLLLSEALRNSKDSLRRAEGEA